MNWILKLKLNEFLKLNDRDILGDLGRVSHEVAETLALGEYEKYRVEQDKNYISDFDREVKKILDEEDPLFVLSSKKPGFVVDFGLIEDYSSVSSSLVIGLEEVI